jgi:hypothetical protein
MKTYIVKILVECKKPIESQKRREIPTTIGSNGDVKVILSSSKNRAAADPKKLH